MKLILLRCPNCTEPLSPNNDDVVVACTNCHIPVAIAVNGAQRMTVQYAVDAGSRVSGSSTWYPFWLFEGRVHITRRETQGGSRSGRKESEKLWGVSRRLYVPAWELDLHVAQEVGGRLIQMQPDFQLVDQPEEVNLVSATVTPKDARKLLDFIVLAIEARRRDWLKNLEFELEIGQPELLALTENSYR